MSDIADWKAEWVSQIFETCFKYPQHRYIFLSKRPEMINSAIDNYACEDRGSGECQENFKNFWFGTSITCNANRERIDQIAGLEEGHRLLSIEPIFGPVGLRLSKQRCPVCGSREIYQENPRTCQGSKPWYCDNCGKWESKDGEDLRPDIDWVIVGAETGNRKEKVIPEREWIQNIVNQCRAAGVPVFLKSSLKDIWGEPLIQEYPW